MKRVTRELHAEVRESLKTMGIVSAAKKHGISLKTASRIKRGGQHLSGYKQVLTEDHDKGLADLFLDDDGTGFEDLQAKHDNSRISFWQPNALDVFTAWLRRLWKKRA